MVSLKEVIRTLRTTSNFWSALALIFSRDRRVITFRNGSTFRLSWLEYCRVRDTISLGCTVEQISDNLFKIGSGKLELVGSSDMLSEFLGMQDGWYDCDCRDKVVLDVGGFQGESAVFFSSMGAKKVIIYEPVVAHHEFIRQNTFSNRVNAELHGEGVGNADGTQTIHYETANIGFGVMSKGRRTMEIRIRNVAEVIEESQADIAKFDCEGAEESLVHVPREVIGKIDFYIIEVHSAEIREAIIRKFNRSGFSLVKEIGPFGPISVIHFRKNRAWSVRASRSRARSRGGTFFQRMHIKECSFLPNFWYSVVREWM